MLHDLDKTLEKYIFELGKINRSEVDVTFDQPTGEWSAKLSRPTINCWPFDLRENVRLRNNDVRYEINASSSRTYMLPRRMDVVYLITAWARDPQDEHQLLWRALAALMKLKKLNPADCVGSLRYHGGTIPLMVATLDDRHQSVNLTDLWSVLENQMRMGFTLMATLEVDSETIIEAPLVLEGRLQVGQMMPPDAPEDAETRQRPEGETYSESRSRFQYGDSKPSRRPRLDLDKEIKLNNGARQDEPEADDEGGATD